jgi:hypothetical protein
MRTWFHAERLASRCVRWQPTTAWPIRPSVATSRDRTLGGSCLGHGAAERAGRARRTAERCVERIVRRKAKEEAALARSFSADRLDLSKTSRFEYGACSMNATRVARCCAKTCAAGATSLQRTPSTVGVASMRYRGYGAAHPRQRLQAHRPGAPGGCVRQRCGRRPRRCSP